MLTDEEIELLYEEIPDASELDKLQLEFDKRNLNCYIYENWGWRCLWIECFDNKSLPEIYKLLKEYNQEIEDEYYERDYYVIELVDDEEDDEEIL